LLGDFFHFGVNHLRYFDVKLPAEFFYMVPWPNVLKVIITPFVYRPWGALPDALRSGADVPFEAQLEAIHCTV
jgi:hypothetical protein